jgi:hypothetical protein
MKRGYFLHALLVALAALGSMILPDAPAQAQPYVGDGRAVPAITGFNVDEVRRLDPGVELNFDLYGTAGGVATLHIDGATRNLHMTEFAPGQYQGTYTIGVHDRLRPDSAVSANLRIGNRVATAVLSESLLRGVGRHEAPARGDLAAVPRVDRFDVRASSDLGPGNDLTFTLFGTPGARVEVTIAGSRGVFFLPEVRAGEYSGTYRIRRDDRILPDSTVTATIRANGRYSTATLGRPLLAGGATAPRVARYCTNCATVEAVNVIELSGNGSYLGTVSRADAAGVVASGRASADLGAARNLRYEVVVRYTDGATQTITYDNDPGFHVGDKVKVNDGVLTRD